MRATLHPPTHGLPQQLRNRRVFASAIQAPAPLARLVVRFEGRAFVSQAICAQTVWVPIPYQIMSYLLSAFLRFLGSSVASCSFARHGFGCWLALFAAVSSLRSGRNARKGLGTVVFLAGLESRLGAKSFVGAYPSASCSCFFFAVRWGRPSWFGCCADIVKTRIPQWLCTREMEKRCACTT